MPLGHLWFLCTAVHHVAVRVKPNEMEREVARQPVLGGDVQHSGHLAEDGLAAVLTFVALNGDHPIEFIDGEIDSGEPLRPLSAKLDDGFTIGGVANGTEKLVQLLLPPFPPLVSSLSVVSFDVLLQIVGLDVAGLTTLHSAHERTVVVVDLHVKCQSPLSSERLATARDLTRVRPLARMSPLMLGGVARAG